VRGKPITLGGSAEVGGSWDADADAPARVRLQLVQLDGYFAVMHGRREIGRIARVGAAGGEWVWRVRRGALGYAATRGEALGALARSWGGALHPPGHANTTKEKSCEAPALARDDSA
jgi:hypothetical protein